MFAPVYGFWKVVRRGTIKMYDYDLEDTNMEHYKQPTPPAYNMTNIPKNVPLFLSYGLRDNFLMLMMWGFCLTTSRIMTRTSLWYSSERIMPIWILLWLWMPIKLCMILYFPSSGSIESLSTVVICFWDFIFL